MDSSELELVKQLDPFDRANENDFKQLVANANIIKFPEGKIIFKRGKGDRNVYWLLAGSINLLDNKFEAKHRKAGDDAARYPIDNNDPHRFSAVSTQETLMLVIDRAETGLQISSSEEFDYAVSDLDAPDEDLDWMSNLLSSPLFEFIPPTNTQTLFSKFEAISYDAGDIVISENEPGESFYVIQTGRVKVERGSGKNLTLLAELKAGDNFGQDALVSNDPRNATITMITSGILMRLDGPDFESLLMKPVIEGVTLEEAQEMVENGDPKTFFLDVRTKNEGSAEKIAGSINIPLSMLRKNLPQLDVEALYVTISEGGKRAELAAYLLNENGFTAYVLR